MRELGRIIERPRLVLALVVILLANGLLFLREQYEKDFCLDLDLPTGGVIFFDGSLTVTREEVDPRAAYRRYTELLDTMRDAPLPEAQRALEEEKETLTARLTGDESRDEDSLDYVAVNNLLKKVEYLAGYGDWLAGIERNKENLLTFSIFNDPDSFSGRNIIKTAEEFEKLRGVELSLVSDGAVGAFMSFRLTDYLLLLALLLVVLSFLEERKAGLWGVVHATPRGRLRLAARRAAILLSASALGVILLYGTDLLIGFTVYGGYGDLDCAVQSVETLGRLPMITSIGGFLLRFLLLRAAAAFLTGLLLWLMVAAVSNVKYTIVVAAAVLAGEYSLYTFLPVQSALNVLKYFNLFTYISLADLYVNYLNIDILGFPLGIRSISQFALVPLVLLLAALCIYVHCHKKPAAGRDLLGRAAYRINSLADKALRRLHIFGMELYKALWVQRGIIIAGLLIYVALGLTYKVNIAVTTSEEQAEKLYTAQFAGEITDDTFASIDAEQHELEVKISAYEEAQAAYSEGSMEYPEFDRLGREASSAKIKSAGLKNVRARCEELRLRGGEEGFTPWLIDDTPFESVYGPAAEANQQKAALTALLALTLLLAGCGAYERQSGMTFLLGSTPRGRGALLLRKLLLAAVMTALVWAAVYGMELYTLLTEFDITAWRAPAKNLPALPDFPFRCSLAAALALLYLCRWLALYSAAALVLLISSLVRRLEASYIAACALMLLPSLLWAYVGIEFLRPLALILPIEAAPVILSSGGGIAPYLLWLSALMLAAAASILRLFYVSERRGHRRAII